MIWLNPGAVWWLLGLPVIVALFLWRRQPREMVVPAVFLWRAGLAKHRRRVWFGGVRRPLALLFALLIYTLVVGALARPRPEGPGHATVLVLDTRARAQATVRVEDDRRGQAAAAATRLAAAKAEALAVAGCARPGREVAVVAAAGESAAVVSPFTGDVKALRRAIRQVVATDAAGSPDAAMALAATLAAGRAAGSPAMAGAAGTPGAQVIFLGGDGPVKPMPNLAFMAFGAARLPASPDTVEVMFDVANFGPERVAADVEVRLDDRLVAVRPVAIAAGGRARETFTFLWAAAEPATPPGREGPAAPPGRLIGRIGTRDALAGDNSAYAVVPPPVPIRVLLVSRGELFLEKFLASWREARFELLAPEAFRAGMETGFAATVFDDWLPPDFDLARAAGSLLLIRRTPFGAGDTAELLSLEPAAGESPLLRLVDLAGIEVLGASPLRLPAAAAGWRWTEVAGSARGPLIAAGQRRDGVRAALFGFRIGDSALPLRAAFPLLMANTLRWLAGRETPLAADAHAAKAGRIAAIGPDQAAWPEPVIGTAPTGAGADASRWVHGAFRPLHNGFYLLRGSAGYRWLAVNRFDAAEADPMAWGRPPPDGVAAAAAARGAWRGGEPAVWLVLAAGALALIEWWLFHRHLIG